MTSNRAGAGTVRRILLVEDEEADVEHFIRLCRKHNVEAVVEVAVDATTALDRLKAAANLGEVIVVTDINLPGMSGHELIREIRQERQISNNVIFVLSTSDLPKDIDEAYANHVAGYIVKDVQGIQLDAGVSMLKTYLSAVVLP